MIAALFITIMSLRQSPAQWLASKPVRCNLIIGSMRGAAGADAASCNDKPTVKDAIVCANDAFHQNRPFTLCDSRWGMDSLFENGVAGLPNGNVLVYYLDTMGPRYRGTCLHPNFSVAPDEWPQCRTALIHEIDLGTEQPRAEMPLSPNEEPWPQSCAADALNAAFAPMAVQLVTGQNPLPNPEEFGYRCRDAVSFEILIDESGRPRCTRVRGVGLRPRVPAAYETINVHLMQWRFKPPMLHGKPLAVRWGMQINPIHPGDRLPGPPIYPECK